MTGRLSSPRERRLPGSVQRYLANLDRREQSLRLRPSHNIGAVRGRRSAPRFHVCHDGCIHRLAR